ncbi:MAG: ribonuclease Y [Candidatus Buchananbacteria bacterium]
MINPIWITITLVAIFGGMVLGFYGRKSYAKRQRDTIETKIQHLLEESKTKQKIILLEAQERALKIIEEAKQEEKERSQELHRAQKRLEQRESLFDQKLLDLENKKQQLLDREQKLEGMRLELQKIKEEQIAKLEKIASLTKEEAQKIIIDNTERQMKGELVQRIQKLQTQAAEEIENEARDLLTLAIQRCAVPQATEITTTMVSLPSDEMKGRIIGREGRNIKTIEQLTGVEIVIDDTPEAITISGFSPIRRHLAKRVLEKLISDGRIHPARIEETIEQVKTELAQEMKKAGEDALYGLGITGLDPKLVQIVGRLKYRTSYGQNILQHSIEVAHLSALLAEELGADVSLAKKGGLLHDIGKAVDQEVQGTHPSIGYNILKKFGLPEDIAYIALAHHEDQPKSLESIIVKVADAISGSRPGARKDSYENYLNRLEDLEKVALAFTGVEKAYAIQAGREIRVFVKPEEIDDLGAIKLARDVAQKIEQELKYPGEIKVNVIRETRIVEYAR